MLKRNVGDPYENLANAIVMQAVYDYRACLRRLRCHPKNKDAQIEKEELLSFFHSDWYTTLTSIPADYLIDKLDQEFADKISKERKKHHGS